LSPPFPLGGEHLGDMRSAVSTGSAGGRWTRVKAALGDRVLDRGLFGADQGLWRGSGLGMVDSSKGRDARLTALLAGR
jgi:hypothetical protein